MLKLTASQAEALIKVLNDEQTYRSLDILITEQESIDADAFRYLLVFFDTAIAFQAMRSFIDVSFTDDQLKNIESSFKDQGVFLFEDETVRFVAIKSVEVELKAKLDPLLPAPILSSVWEQLVNLRGALEKYGELLGVFHLNTINFNEYLDLFTQICPIQTQDQNQINELREDINAVNNVDFTSLNDRVKISAARAALSRARSQIFEKIARILLLAISAKFTSIIGDILSLHRVVDPDLAVSDLDLLFCRNLSEVNGLIMQVQNVFGFICNAGSNFDLLITQLYKTNIQQATEIELRFNNELKQKATSNSKRKRKEDVEDSVDEKTRLMNHRISSLAKRIKDIYAKQCLVAIAQFIDMRIAEISQLLTVILDAAVIASHPVQEEENVAIQNVPDSIYSSPFTIFSNIENPPGPEVTDFDYQQYLSLK